MLYGQNQPAGSKAAKEKVAKSDVPALQSCPQKRGVCTRVYTTTPEEAELSA